MSKYLNISFLKTLGMSVLMIFSPIKPVLFVTGLLVILDMIFGIWAAKVRKEPITSSRMKDSITKLLVYELCIMLFYIGQKYMTTDLIPLTNIASTFVCLVELKSIAESLKDISGVDILEFLISKLNGLMNKN